MSLTDRLLKIERRLDALEARTTRGEQVQEALVQVVEQAAQDDLDDDPPTPSLTLDGEDAGGERDQSQSLDG